MFYIFNKVDEWEERHLALVWVFETFLSGYFLEYRVHICELPRFYATLTIWKQWRYFVNNMSTADYFNMLMDEKKLRLRLFLLLKESFMFWSHITYEIPSKHLLKKDILMKCIRNSEIFRGAIPNIFGDCVIGCECEKGKTNQ